MVLAVSILLPPCKGMVCLRSKLKRRECSPVSGCFGAKQSTFSRKRNHTQTCSKMRAMMAPFHVQIIQVHPASSCLDRSCTLKGTGNTCPRLDKRNGDLLHHGVTVIKVNPNSSLPLKTRVSDGQSFSPHHSLLVTSR